VRDPRYATTPIAVRRPPGPATRRPAVPPHASPRMHPPLQELADLLDRERAALLAVWDRIPAADRERRAAPDQWSPAEVLAHLGLVETGSARLLARRLARAREAGLGAETDHGSRRGALAGYDIARSPARFAAPDAVVPPTGVTAAAAEAGLAESRAALRALLAEADGLALGEVKANHMRFGELDMYGWLAFIAQHEARHAAQLLRMAASAARG